MMKIKTKKLSDGTVQIGYKTTQGWVGVCNIFRSKGGWISDTWAGWEPTITAWKERVLIYVDGQKF